MRSLIIILLFIVVSVPSFAQNVKKPSATKKTPSDTNTGPFGLRMGMTKAQLGAGLKEIGPHKFSLTKVPKPHDAFESYVVTIGPTTGVCYIKGVGKNIRTSVYGTELVSKYESLRDLLSKIYGKYGEIDNLRSGSIWNEPKDWMMALLKNERSLMARWCEEEQSTLKPTIKGIYMGAEAISTEMGYVSVDYMLENYDQCMEEIKAEASEAL